MDLTYVECPGEVEPSQLDGFFEGWPDPPSPATLLRILRGSDHVVLARESRTGRVVGFVTAITDGVLAAYIPLLEVLPGYRGQGVGRGLVARVLGALDGYYMIDLVCDPELRPFYAKLGMRPAVGMAIRNFEAQSGR